MTLYTQHIDAAFDAPSDTLAANMHAGAAPLLALAAKTDDLAEIEAFAADIRARFKTVVVVGSGGSGLSGKALLQMKLMKSSPSFYFLDNIDPETILDVLSRGPLADMFFLVISKSGGTIETLAQYYALCAEVEKRRGQKAVAQQFAVIVQPGDSPLRASADAYGIRVLDHAPDVGGRYAILSVVGLLPAAIAGLNIRTLRAGAEAVLADMRAPAEGAAAMVAAMRRGQTIAVLFPYGEQLTGLSAWWRQNWAESLGKNGMGSTPAPALGSTDQHSQLQLYLDGPRDKFFTFITLSRRGQGPRIDAPTSELHGKTLGDIMEAQQRATYDTLVARGCPARRLALSALDEKAFGALIMHFTLEIIFAAQLMGVNPFDQPAVEESKRLTQHYLQAGAS